MEKTRITIPVNHLKGEKFNYAFYECEEYYIVVTHGSKSGELQSPSGKTIRHEQFCENIISAVHKKGDSSKEIVVFACHADTRPSEYKGVQLNPLKSKGEIDTQFFEYFDPDDDEEYEGEIIIVYEKE